MSIGCAQRAARLRASPYSQDMAPTFCAMAGYAPPADGIQDFSKRGYDELHDIEADPSESYSVAERHPEVVADMKQRLADAQARFDPFRKGVPPFFQKAGAPKATQD